MQSTHDEVWKPVVGYEGLYEVSDHGGVRSMPRKGTAGGLVSVVPNEKGYLTVGLFGHGKRVHRSVHRLMAEAFLGPCPDGMQVRHLDGNNTHNVLPNLKWGTASENAYDRVRHGTDAGSRRTHCKSGHEFTPENTRHTGTQRVCRACKRESAQRRRAARRSEISA